MTTVFDIRRANLVSLLQKYPSTAAFNVAVGKKRKNPGFTMIKNQVKNGDKVRVMGDALAREVEAKLSLPVGWMDSEHRDRDSVGYIEGETAEVFPMKTLKLAGADPMKEERVFLDQETLDKYFPGRGREGFAAAIVHDETMSPAVRTGDRVLIDETKSQFTTDGIYCLDVGGVLVLKRITFSLTGRHIVSADAAPEERTALEDLPAVRIVGRVCAVWNCRPI